MAFISAISAFLAPYAGAIAAAGTAISVVGAIRQGQQAEQAGKYNAAVAANNAIAARQQASANAEAQQRKARLQIGSMRAGYGASGIGMEGSPLDILEQSAAMAELDRQNILYSGELRSSGYESTSGLELMRGNEARKGSYYSAASSLLMGAAKVGALSEAPSGVSSWLDYENSFDDGSMMAAMNRVG